MVAARVLAAKTMPLWPIDMPPVATTGHACHGAPAGAVVTDRWRVGTIQLTSPTSVEPPSISPGSRSSGSDVALEADRLDARGALDLARELLLRFGELDRSQPHHVVVDQRGAGQDGQHLPVAGLDGEAGGGAGGERRTLGDLPRAFQQPVDAGVARIPEPAPDLGMGGHDVGDIARVGNDIVHAHRGPHVLAHQIEREGKDLHPIGSAAPVPGIEGGVRGAAFEVNHKVHHRLVALRIGDDLVARMPRERNVEVVEETGAHHVHLAAHRLLGRRAIETHRAAELAGGDQLLDGKSGAEARGPEQIVPATVARRSLHQRLGGRLGALRDAGQCVVLAQDADDRAAFPETGDEGGRHFSDAPFDLEALRFRVVREERGRTGFAERRFGKGPDLVGKFNELRPVGVDGCHGRLLGGLHLCGDRRRGGENTDQQAGERAGLCHDVDSPAMSIRRLEATTSPTRDFIGRLARIDAQS